MNKPVIADNRTAKVLLQKDREYYFCTCGRSGQQPFCDGSHAGTDFQPLAFTAREDGKAYLCACKHSRNLPYCDGSHNRFGDAQVGREGPGTE